MTDAWTLAATARRDFADMVEGLTPEQLEDTTLCDGWTPKDVTAHLVTFVDVPLPKFMFNVLKQKGNFDAAAIAMAEPIAQRPMDDLVSELRDKAEKKSVIPMFPGELTLVDAMTHTQDVRRALDLDGELDPEMLAAALEFLATHKRAGILLETKGLLDGLRLEATDIDWSHGDGELVSGPAEALMMAILRRPAHDELTGDGVATLQARQSDR